MVEMNFFSLLFSAAGPTERIVIYEVIKKDDCIHYKSDESGSGKIS